MVLRYSGVSAEGSSFVAACCDLIDVCFGVSWLGIDVQDALLVLQMQHLHSIRSVTASFMLLAHVIALTESIAQAGARYRETVRRGSQPPLNGYVMRRGDTAVVGPLARCVILVTMSV